MKLIVYLFHYKKKNNSFWTTTFFDENNFILENYVFQSKPAGIDIERRIKTFLKKYLEINEIVIQENDKSLLEKYLLKLEGKKISTFKDSETIKKYISYLTEEYRYNDSNLEKYLIKNNFLSSDIKMYFLQPSKNIWNEKIVKKEKENETNLLSKKEQLNEEKDYFKKINDLKIITNELAYYSNNSEAKLLQFKIDTFLKTINPDLKKNDPKFESLYFHLKKLYLFIRNRLKKINVKIIKDHEFILHLLERLGTDSVRQSEYRVLQYQMIFLLICYSKLNLKDIRTLTLEKLKKMMEESTSLIHPKGIKLLKEKIDIYETFFKVYPALGSSLNTKKISLMAYTTFSNILNIELRRILIELNLYNEGDELITIPSLLNKKNCFF